MRNKDEIFSIFYGGRDRITEAYLKTCDSMEVMTALSNCFKDKQTQYIWLNSHNLLLHGKCPLDVMWCPGEKNGAQRVLDIIEAQL